MKTVQDELRKQLLQSADIRLLEEDSWSVPAVQLAVTYETVTKTTMDILMKMILLTVQRLPVEKAEELSDLLGVETLFITDLLCQMETDGLLGKDGTWKITAAGSRQLDAGQYVHAAEQEQTRLLYIPMLGTFLPPYEVVSDGAEPLFRHAAEEPSWTPEELSTDQLETALSQAVGSTDTQHLVKTLGSVTDVTSAGMLTVPCYEFRLYNKREDALSVRVWNTASEQWDAGLEDIILAKDLPDWRGTYLERGE